MNEQDREALPQTDAGRVLAWEDLGRQPASKAFRQSLRQLVLHPGRFFELMATEGGLREALMFYWTMATLTILMGFPLALAHFALTAPDPLEVSTEVYNLHALAPRATGFALLLLPVVLVAGGLLMVLSGTLFHVGARLFGARNWEGSVSIFCYAKGGGAAPFVLAEALAMVVAVACWLLTLIWPGAADALGSVANTAVWVLGGAGLLVGTFLVFVAAVVGCTKAFKLEPATGAAAGLAGMLVPTAAFVAPIVSARIWGGGGAVTAAGAMLVLLAVLTAVGHAAGRAAARPEQPSEN